MAGKGRKRDGTNYEVGYGKPPVETNRRLTAQLIDDHSSGSVPNSPATIARALTGRGLGR